MTQFESKNVVSRKIPVILKSGFLGAFEETTLPYMAYLVPTNRLIRAAYKIQGGIRLSAHNGCGINISASQLCRRGVMSRVTACFMLVGYFL